MKHLLKFLSISVCLLSLTACETVEGLKEDIASIDFSNLGTAASVKQQEKQSNFLVDGNCPEVNIVDELSMLNEFSAGNTTKSSNLISSVRMNEAQSTCEFGERSVTVDLKLAFDGMLGAKGRSTSKEKPFFSYPFFVAVTSPSGKILAKEIFAASMTYDVGETEQRYFETLRQIIPADSRAQGSRYKIMIGFQLAEKQLTYNRRILEDERLAAEQAEQKRLAAEQIAAETAKAEAVINETTSEAAQKVSTTTEELTVPKATRAGPFDILKN